MHPLCKMSLRYGQLGFQQTHAHLLRCRHNFENKKQNEILMYKNYKKGITMNIKNIMIPHVLSLIWQRKTGIAIIIIMSIAALWIFHFFYAIHRVEYRSCGKTNITRIYTAVIIEQKLWQFISCTFCFKDLIWIYKRIFEQVMKLKEFLRVWFSWLIFLLHNLETECVWDTSTGPFICTLYLTTVCHHCRRVCNNQLE